MGFNERIKHLARTKGYSIASLERELGYSRGSIMKMQYQKNPNARTYELASFLGVTEDYLLNGNETGEYYENKESAEIAQHLLDRPDHKVLFDAIKGVKPEDVDFVKQLIERFCDDQH